MNKTGKKDNRYAVRQQCAQGHHRGYGADCPGDQERQCGTGAMSGMASHAQNGAVSPIFLVL